MSTGIILPSLTSLASSTSEAMFIGARSAALRRFADITSKAPQISSAGLKLNINDIQIDTSIAWTPPQWSQPALTIISVIYTFQSFGPDQTFPVQVDFVFDAIFKTVHRRIVRKTSHPVLTGANISDHAYVEPVRISLEIGMSDAMSSYTSGMWTGAATKSISAWQKIKEWQINKTLLTITTRLDTYQRMIIIEAESPDDNISRHGLRASIVCEELLSASILTGTPASDRPQATNDTQGGPVQAVPPNPSAIEQFMLPSPLYPDADTFPQVPGAGRIGGNNQGTQLPTPPTP